MSRRGPLKDVEPWGEGRWIAICPGCGIRARIDRDQYEGKVSVDCPECSYHETHDHRRSAHA